MAIGKKTGGRRKGTPNKTTIAVKEALTDAFEQLGGVSSLVGWGRENPDEFYKLWVKMLPAEIKGSLEHSGTINTPLVIELAYEHSPDQAAE